MFYVALTRTKNDVYLLVPESKRSIFIDDLNKIPKNKKHIETFTQEATEENCERLNLKENEKTESHVTDKSCPICKTGKITLIVDNRPENFINNEPKKFFRCSNDSCRWYGGSYYGDLDELKYIDKCRNCMVFYLLKMG